MITVLKSEFEKLYNMACASWKPKLDEAMKGQTFSDKLSFEENFVEQMQNACTAEQKPVFDSIFAKHIQSNLFSIKKIEEVYERLNKKMPTIEDFMFLGDKQAKKQLNLCHIKHIEELFGFIADFNNGNQEKWYPYFERKSSGWVFGGSVYYFSYFDSGPAFFKDRKTADFVGKTFLDIYVATH